ncbi:hypothetical protein [Breoghania sp.]|uniref:hypothetical protein n=1 Tax=Breoghania sp. TaxID=2065378 RepID=UPI002AA778DD|nr:hypothetical protein [Breoghania sp.]
MGVFEVSFLYGLFSSLFKSPISIVVVAVLFAVVCFLGLLASPFDFSSGLQIVFAAWLSFNAGLLCFFILPLILPKRVSKR